MTIKELKEKIKNTPDNFEVLVYHDEIGFLKVIDSSEMFSLDSDDGILLKYGSFNLEIKNKFGNIN